MRPEVRPVAGLGGGDGSATASLPIYPAIPGLFGRTLGTSILERCGPRGEIMGESIDGPHAVPVVE